MSCETSQDLGPSSTSARMCEWISITGGGSVSLIALAYEIGYALIRVRQRFLVGQKDNAEVPGAGLLAEARAVHDHDMFLKNKFLHEHRVVLGNIQPGI